MKKTKPKFKLDEDLAQLMNDASEVSGNSETSEKKTTAKETVVINIPITENDDDVSIALKNLINNSGITNQELYDIKGQRNAYNMIYSFKNKGQLGIDRIKEWAKILHCKPVLTFVEMTDEEAAAADAELMTDKKEKEDTKTSKKKKK